MWSGALLSFRPSIHPSLLSLSNAAMKYYAAFLPSSSCRGACKNAAAAGLLFPCDVFPPRDGSPSFFPLDRVLGRSSLACRVVSSSSLLSPHFTAFHCIMRRLPSPLHCSEFRLIGETLTNQNPTFGIPRGQDSNCQFSSHSCISNL